MIVGLQDDNWRRVEAFLGHHGPEDLDLDSGKDAAVEEQVGSTISSAFLNSKTPIHLLSDSSEIEVIER